MRGLVAALALLLAGPAVAQVADLGAAPARAWREEVLHIPAVPGGPRLVVTLVRPDGPGPFPLAVLNHGASAGVTETATRNRDSFATYYFLSRGYAVALPMMRGFAGSEGKLHVYSCDAQTLASNGARDIANVITELTRRPDIDGTQVVVAGQSFGGWNTLAVGAEKVRGVRALINFNGGVNIGDCRHKRETLVSGAEVFGSLTTVPSLWFYGDTDTLFPPATWRAMFAAYTGRGGPAEIVDVGDGFTDSHHFLVDANAAAKWMPRADAFLARAGLPATLVFPGYLPPAYPPPSGFAAVGDVDKVPFLNDNGRAAYRTWLTHPTPRVVAISPSGKLVGLYGGFDPASEALRRCIGVDHAMCRLYAVDNDVVWHALPPAPPPTGFAPLTDAAAIPYLTAASRAVLARFLARPAPRALVISKAGGVFGSYGVHAWEQAWVNCTGLAKSCEPYIVDDAVVWKAGLYADVAGPQFRTTLRGPAEKPLQVTADNSTISVAGTRTSDEAGAARTGAQLLGPALLAAAFENAPQGALAVVRHRASGLICRDPRVVIVTPVANEPEFKPAPVAACISRVAGLQSDLSVTRLPAGMTLSQALDAIVARVRLKDKDLAPAQPSAPGRVTLHGATTPLTIALAAGQGGNWLVWAAIRTDDGHAAQAGRLAAALLRTALADMAP